MEALEWNVDSQPLLLTLPDDEWIKTVNWFALWDHKRQVRTSFLTSVFKLEKNIFVFF